ncbi:MAG TPA: hypothetical protein VJC07_05260, partial [Candidatus Nanoarchaeia archaeon]|nr:hypothetical protein [Candidatus Nanoarchaeia archaeon]
NVYREFDDPQVVPRLLEIFQNKQDYQDNQPEEQSKVPENEYVIPEVMARFTLPTGCANVDKNTSHSPAYISAKDKRCEDIIKKISHDSELKATPRWDEDQAKEYAFRLLGNDIHESIGAMVSFAYDTRRELRKLGRFEIGKVKGNVRISGGISGLDDIGMRLEYKIGKDSKLFLEWMREAGAESVTDDAGDDSGTRLMMLTHPRYGSQTWKATDFTESYLMLGYELKFR